MSRWITRPLHAILFYYLELVVVWILCIYAACVVGRDVTDRSEAALEEIKRSAPNDFVNATRTVARVRQRALIQLRVYLTIFICFSTFGLVNRLVQFIAPEDANARALAEMLMRAGAHDAACKGWRTRSPLAARCAAGEAAGARARHRRRAAPPSSRRRWRRTRRRRSAGR